MHELFAACRQQTRTVAEELVGRQRRGDGTAHVVLVDDQVVVGRLRKQLVDAGVKGTFVSGDGSLDPFPLGAGPLRSEGFAFRLEAMDEMGRSSGVEDLHNFIQAIIQSEQFGTGIGKILRIQADEMRRKRRQRAQELGAQATLKMMLPMVGCIFPTLWIVLLGPAALILLMTTRSHTAGSLLPLISIGAIACLSCWSQRLGVLKSMKDKKLPTSCTIIQRKILR